MSRIAKKLEELRRICCAEAERARQLKYDGLSTQKEENPPSVDQLMVQIQELQDKVNSVNDAREFYDSVDYSTFPSQSMSVPSPRGMISRDSCLKYVWYIKTRFFEDKTCSKWNHQQHSSEIRSRMWHRLLAD